MNGGPRGAPEVTPGLWWTRLGATSYHGGMGCAFTSPPRFGLGLALAGVCLLAGTFLPRSVAADETTRSEVGPRGSSLKGARGPLWSLEPLARPDLPSLPPGSDAPASPIDAFVRARLRAEGLEPSPRADRRTLIRRVYFDLIGLPPPPSEIADLLAADDFDAAYARLVERLLDSPAYGERWARHWLDVVHYGESHGYDKDQPRPNAWPYRDYVIRAFNEDRPYGRFIEEQVAGDVLYPDTRDGLEGPGFIAAGPWDLIGHAEVPETKTDGKIARHLDRDDMVTTTLQTFNSLTVQCAQCHDHKFDPISQEDYYSLQAVFAAVDRTDRRYDTDPAVAHKRTELSGRSSDLAARIEEATKTLAKRAGEELEEVDRRIAARASSGKREDAFGYHSNIEPGDQVVKWVQVDLGQTVPLGRVTLHPASDGFNQIGDGFGFPLRYRIEISDDPTFSSGVRRLADHTGADVPNPGISPRTVDAGGAAARYVRVTATRLAPRLNDYIFALAELSATSLNGTNLALGAAVSALDSIEAPVRWQRTNLTDGYFPGAPAVEAPDISALRKQRDELLERTATPAERALLTELRNSLEATRGELGALPPQSLAYVGAVHTGSGAFLGTGGKGGQPRPIHVLPRGDVLKPGAEVGPGALSALRELPARFELPPGHAEGARRADLAHWLSSPKNPLTWRSIVNRIWLHHFGRGLVETPNDFGRMGARPSHPELLDWLAVELRDGGQSIKRLHRLILLSETYRQASAVPPREKDSDNVLLWRMTPRKLEAEAVRDTILAVAGKLRLDLGGPSFQDFVIEKPEHSPHYEYHLHDPEDPRSHRRSIYRFIIRSQPQPFLTTLDCADPSMIVGKRNESLSPLQALGLLNNELVLCMSRHFAERVVRGGGNLREQAARAFLEAMGREASAPELEALTSFAEANGLVNLCRVIFNLNELIFID